MKCLSCLSEPINVKDLCTECEEDLSPQLIIEKLYFDQRILDKAKSPTPKKGTEFCILNFHAKYLTIFFPYSSEIEGMYCVLRTLGHEIAFLQN